MRTYKTIYGESVRGQLVCEHEHVYILEDEHRFHHVVHRCDVDGGKQPTGFDLRRCKRVGHTGNTVRGRRI